MTHSQQCPTSPTRRAVLRAGLAVAACGPATSGGAEPAAPARPPGPEVMTVRGPVAASTLGVTLPHEHVVVDFLGAEKADAPRHDAEAAFRLALPHLERLATRGCRTLVECTPKYIGRDAALLLRLSTASGLNVVTNTGYYGAVNNRYLPRHAFDETAAQLARRWLAEWTGGIDGTGVRPGFLKLGTGSGKLPEEHRKLVRAAAEVHLAAGLAIAIHTGDGAAALDELRLLREAGVSAEAMIWVHAQNDPGPAQLEAAGQGAWVSLDGFSLGRGNPERYVRMILALRSAGLLGRVLVSHDDGWAVEGEGPRGGLKPFANGNPAPYQSVFERLIPDLRKEGLTPEEVDQLTVKNPAEALAIRVRKV